MLVVSAAIAVEIGLNAVRGILRTSRPIDDGPSRLPFGDGLRIYPIALSGSLDYSVSTDRLRRRGAPL